MLEDPEEEEEEEEDLWREELRDLVTSSEESKHASFLSPADAALVTRSVTRHTMAVTHRWSSHMSISR